MTCDLTITLITFALVLAIAYWLDFFDKRRK